MPADALTDNHVLLEYGIKIPVPAKDAQIQAALILDNGILQLAVVNALLLSVLEAKIRIHVNASLVPLNNVPKDKIKIQIIANASAILLPSALED